MTQTDLLTEVINAVAAADGVEPTEVDSLYDYIDPEILETLDEMENGRNWRFTFQYGDHQITVTPDSQIFLDGELYRSEKSV
jgi:hypothetical protein